MAALCWAEPSSLWGFRFNRRFRACGQFMCVQKGRAGLGSPPQKPCEVVSSATSSLGTGKGEGKKKNQTLDLQHYNQLSGETHCLQVNRLVSYF